MLRELSQYYKEIDIVDIERFFEREKRMYTVQSRKTFGNLMNYEGRIATFYWALLAKVFNKLYPTFNSRVGRTSLIHGIITHLMK